MKIRTDFVTNSSSSSFVIAKKGKLNEKQKEAIIDFIEKKFLGKSYEPDTPIKKIEENIWLGDNKDTVEELKKEGFSISTGYVSFEESEYHLTDIYKKIWDIIEENSDGNFKQISTDLKY